MERKTLDIFSKEFAREVKIGLNSSPKRLSSLYFYDDEGSRIFQRIMSMEEYYLTDSEASIFRDFAIDIIEQTGFKTEFRVVELGAGDGMKTEILLKKWKSHGLEFIYSPIDISEEANKMLVNRLKDSVPALEIDARRGDYFDVIKEFHIDRRPLLLLFLGSNIGNFPPPLDREMMQTMADAMRPKDHLLIGIDLKKDPVKIRDAYFDRGGITKEFNLNLLRRINRELDGDFDMDKWDFYSYYDPLSGEVKSFLFCTEEQTVTILGEQYQFDRHETIWTELSRKYSLDQIQGLGSSVGLKSKAQFTDVNGYFSDTLFYKS